jgi:hypothetical protein
MISWERPMCRENQQTEVPPTFEIINRFPILIGFESARANRSSQLPGNASIRPPNSLSRTDESLRERHTISSSKRLRPGRRTITSWPSACAWRKSSCALTQRGSALLRHRNTGKPGAGDEARTRDVHLGKVVAARVNCHTVAVTPMNVALLNSFTPQSQVE